MAQQTEKYNLAHQKEDILETFRRYDFKDANGHELLLCNEFQQLVDWYCDFCRLFAIAGSTKH